jgi:hypothetical protein
MGKREKGPGHSSSGPRILGASKLEEVQNYKTEAEQPRELRFRALVTREGAELEAAAHAST